MVKSHEWRDMEINEVWDLAELPVGVKPVGGKGAYKTKTDSKVTLIDLRSD